MVRPGSKKTGYRDPALRRQRGAFVEERVAWVRTNVGQLVLMVYPDGIRKTGPDGERRRTTVEVGPDVQVIIPTARGTSIAWDLSGLTGDELAMLREFLILALDAAEPVVRIRDKVAQDAYDAGDDAYARLYRQVPQLIIREGAKHEHSPGIHEGLVRVSDSNVSGGGPSDSEGRVRGTGDVVDDDGALEGEPQDDGLPTD